jgi:hypothetical protein
MPTPGALKYPRLQVTVERSWRGTPEAPENAYALIFDGCHPNTGVKTYIDTGEHDTLDEAYDVLYAQLEEDERPAHPSADDALRDIWRDHEEEARTHARHDA